MKRNAFLSSVLTIVLCLSLIAGSTFALFTSETFVTIEVDAGRVNIKAGLTQPVLYSVDPVEDGETATEYDEHGKGYVYEKQQLTFANGGTATLDDATGVISLVNITPGDKIEFSLNGINDSDVAVQYRYKIDVIEGYDLMGGCIVTVNGTKYPSLAAYTSAWESLAVNNNIGEVKLALELPVSAGNQYQEKKAQVKISVEAVQANADVTETDLVSVKYITAANDAGELAAKLASNEYLHIFIGADIDIPVIVDHDLTDKTIDANGHNVALTFGVADTNRINLNNVAVKNLKTSGLTVKSGVSGDLTVTDSNFTGNGNYIITGGGDQARLDRLSVTFDNCTFDGSSNPIRFYHLVNLTVRKCTFKNTKSWAILINGSNSDAIKGNIVITDCTFDNCTGIVKAAVGGGLGTGSLSGNFTFANNKLYNCKVKNDVYMDIEPVGGMITFSNNTHNDVVVFIADMKCQYLTDKYNAQ